MSDGFWIALMTEHGPWALLVFWLLFRDQKKDEGARAAHG